MNPVEATHLSFGGQEESAAPWLGEGWHGPEPSHRWTDGARSVVRLPPLRAQPWFVLTLCCEPFNPSGVEQTLTVELNGVEIFSYRPTPRVPFAIPISGERLRETDENVLVLQPSQAISPVDLRIDEDARVLALAFQSIDLEPLDNPPHARPRLLPAAPAPADEAQAKRVVEAFQSLGQDCFVGLVQRRYGAEPFGLLRFAGMPPERLIAGLRSRFEGLGDASKLTLFEEAGTLHGKHADYWMVYHLFRKAENVDLAALALTEAKRLAYLARLFFEQLENDEKIFARTEDFESDGAALALHRVLCAYHPRARLVIFDAAPEGAQDKIGRVFVLRPGLYRAYLARGRRRGEEALPHHAEWLRLMATVVAYERAEKDIGADRIRLTFGGEAPSAEPYLGEGWHGAEPSHRWTDGARSVLRLPPLRAQPWFMLTLQFRPLSVGGVSQRLSVTLNGGRLARLQNADVMRMHVSVPGDLIRAAEENILVLDHPDAARPNEIEPSNPDNRILSLPFEALDLAPTEESPLAPRLLPPAEPPTQPGALKAFAEAFQSLGKNCDLGMFQRKCGAEPFGLLRFAAVRDDQLLLGLKTRFAGVGDLDKLSFFREPDDRNLQGHHAVYGFNYHTFRSADETDIAEFAAKEAMRLRYLARLFFEQLERDEKIFVRVESFDTTPEALALHDLLREFHPHARLLLVSVAPAHTPERVNRVVEIRPGLYRGYLARLSDPSPALDRSIFEGWLKLCACVLAHDRGLAGAAR